MRQAFIVYRLERHEQIRDYREVEEVYLGTQAGAYARCRLLAAEDGTATPEKPAGRYFPSYAPLTEEARP